MPIGLSITGSLANLEMAGAGIFTHCYLGGCTIRDIYGDPLGDPILCLPIQIFNATSFLVERCTIHHCGQAANPKGSQGGIGGLVFLECDQCVAQFNECHHMVGKPAAFQAGTRIPHRPVLSWPAE